MYDPQYNKLVMGFANEKSKDVEKVDLVDDAFGENNEWMVQKDISESDDIAQQ